MLATAPGVLIVAGDDVKSDEVSEVNRLSWSGEGIPGTTSPESSISCALADFLIVLVGRPEASPAFVFCGIW